MNNHQKRIKLILFLVPIFNLFYAQEIDTYMQKKYNIKPKNIFMILILLSLLTLISSFILTIYLLFNLEIELLLLILSIMILLVVVILCYVIDYINVIYITNNKSFSYKREFIKNLIYIFLLILGIIIMSIIVYKFNRSEFLFINISLLLNLLPSLLIYSFIFKIGMCYNRLLNNKYRNN